MIIEKLKDQQDFTSVECSLADYILNNGFELRHMSISDLAEASFSSPATITRFCRKLGVSGFRDFRILFSQEFETYIKSQDINYNLPFDRGDSFELIAAKMSAMNEASIRNVISCFDYDQLKRITYKLDQADIVNIFAIGTSAIVSLDFQTKLLRFGKQINVDLNSSFLPGYALSSTDRSFNLIISHSGTKNRILECARILRKKQRYIVSVTACTDGELASLSDEVLSAKTGEHNSFTEKMESFSTFYAVHFILDCLYCFLYRLNFDRNALAGRERAELLTLVESKSD